MSAKEGAGLPRIEGHYLLLKIGKRFAARRLQGVLKKVLKAELANGEEAEIVALVLSQLEMNFQGKLETPKGASE